MEQMHGLMVPPCGHEFICRWVVVVFLSWRKGGREKGGGGERGGGNEEREEGREERGEKRGPA